MKMRRMAIMSLLVFDLSVTHQTWAWGCQGHQIVANIASHKLV
jgi:hypothetical protein